MKLGVGWLGARVTVTVIAGMLMLAPGRSAFADYTHGHGSSGMFDIDTYAQVLYPDTGSVFGTNDHISFETAHYYTLHNTDSMNNQNLTYNFGETLSSGLLYGGATILASNPGTNITYAAGPGGTYTQSEADLGYNAGPFDADTYYVRASTYIIVSGTTVSMATQDHTFSTH